MTNSTCRHFLRHCVSDAKKASDLNGARALCISGFDQCTRPCVTGDDVEMATRRWCDGLVRLSAEYNNSAFTDERKQKAAREFVQDMYRDERLLFKPTLATGDDDSRYRQTRQQAKCYFVGSNGDRGDGFANRYLWMLCTPVVNAATIDGCVATALGSVELEGRRLANNENVRVKVDKTWTFVSSPTDPTILQIVSHHSSRQV